MRALLFVALMGHALAAHAWGADGHQAVGTIAADLIKGTPAEARVQALLGGITLAQAAVWADCAKGIEPSRDYAYTSAGRYAECAPLETPVRMAEMSDYVRRNDNNCARKPKDESCHKQYHYTDVAIQRSRYLLGFTGTFEFDVVSATRAAILVLQGQPAPTPFSFKSPREALLVLVHYLGDIHQPLHVGSIYLDADGHRVDPDKTGYDPATFTVGGNSIVLGDPPAHAAVPVAPAASAGLGPDAAPAGAFFGPPKFHSAWDGVPQSLDPAHVNADWLKAAKAVATTKGAPPDWPAQWASGTLDQAGKAFKGLSFSDKIGTHWYTNLPAGYNVMATGIKRQQLTLAGARLAQVLKAVFVRAQ
jgi:hypothetical protein